ncbi:hypothetical protein AAHA92_14210 [Salvia divinorum]|uniref:Uncharacterized protein n=1 Tax=Salvia divinorum TaxID=28513 RepID=A0ABD1HAU3_SALDI
MTGGNYVVCLFQVDVFKCRRRLCLNQNFISSTTAGGGSVSKLNDGMFLTNTFLIPYMAIRLSEAEEEDTPRKTSQLGSLMTKGAPIVELTGGLPWLIGDNFQNIRHDKVASVSLLRFIPVDGLVSYCLCLDGTYHIC